MHGTYNIQIQYALVYDILLDLSAFPHACTYSDIVMMLLRNYHFITALISFVIYNKGSKLGKVCFRKILEPMLRN